MAVPNRGYIGRTFTRDQSVLDAKIAPGTAKRIWKFIAPYKRTLAFFFVLIVIDAAIGVANPLIYRAIINHGILGHNTALIIDFAVLAFALALVDAGLSLAETKISARVSQGLVFDMRTKVFAHIQAMPLAFFSRTQTGALVSRLNNDVLGAQQAFSDVLSVLLGNFMTVLFVLAAMFVLSWKLTLFALVILPFFVIPARRLGKRIQELTRESYELSADMNNTMIEHFNVSGALLVKLFGRPREETGIFEAKAGRLRDLSVTQALYTRIFFVALLLTAAVATAIAYGWGGALAVKGVLDVGTIVALVAYLGRLYVPLTSLSNLNVDVLTALVSFERVFEVLDLVPMIAEKPDAKRIPRGQAKIEFDHVKFRYPSADEVSIASLESVATLSTTPEKEALFDISFTAEPGQLVALVGPSGAGKTTITQLAVRIYDATEGAVRVNGIDVRDATLASLHASVSAVTQEASMFHDSIRANMLYAKPGASEHEILEALRAAQILPFVESLPEGLETVVGDRGYRVSGGEKQRLAIARLLLKAPDIIILDEATAHLDTESEHAVQKALQAALAGRTSIVIAHRLSTIQNADQILVIQNGRIVERGRHKELLARGKVYAKLYHRQFTDKKAPRK